MGWDGRRETGNVDQSWQGKEAFGKKRMFATAKKKPLKTQFPAFKTFQYVSIFLFGCTVNSAYKNTPLIKKTSFLKNK